MSTGTKERTHALDEHAIARYLATHPDFFDRHPQVLHDMHIPHATSGVAVSLIERQVALLREEKRRYKQQLEELIAIARDNDQLNRRLHRLTLSLIDAATFDEVLNALQDELHDKFQADAVELRLFSSTRLNDHTGDVQIETAVFKDFFEKGRPVCGPLDIEQLEYLFSVEAEGIQSAALIPLRAEGVLGMLAIGSRDKARFTPNKGTDFLVRLGEVVSRTLEVVSLPGV